MRVAVVNEAPYHLEIVAGLLQALDGMPVDVTWYQAGQTTADGTLSPTELVEVTGFAQLLGYLPLMKPNSAQAAPCDYAILVSPEYFLQATKVSGYLRCMHVCMHTCMARAITWLRAWLVEHANKS
jgi:hypothetical protein